MKIIESLKMRWIVWVWNHTPSCSEMSRLASQALEQQLPLGLRFRVRLHHLICVWCKRYFKQLTFLHAAAPHFGEHATSQSGRSMSAEAKLRIVQRLQGGLR